eukprot:CAMPEP_0117649860 /NCGR_PEP_ID=MMETSP0804-20121206/1221_1 /TAXON_ID=1074897 /ORGANISM="Tetraselmis astigmatica, Strain CCMP880" /LENGTH=231 /DNA_ID=CAMNT_0005455673 /DNA_START=418 /DNA_END=1113 /DNA_ORIENTATION=-
MTRTGRIAFLTNYREGLSSLKPADTVVSRGAIVTDFLESDVRPMEYLRGLECSKFQHFSLVVGDFVAMEFMYLNSMECTPTELAPGVHGFSNGGLDTTAWRKAADGKRDLSAFLEQNTDPSALAPSVHDVVTAVLSSRQKTAEDGIFPHTPNPPEAERNLSSIFIDKLNVKGRPYGTRSQTVILLKPNGDTVFYEAHLDPSGAWLNQTNQFSIQGVSNNSLCPWSPAREDK